jgi:uncharacterized protein (DUF1499 family)
LILRRAVALLATVAAALASTLLPQAAQARSFACPGSPNCVSSDAQGDRAIAPLRIRGEPQAAWQAVEKTLQRTERVRIVAREADYLRAEFTTRWMRYVDDVELELRAQQRIIAVRSASRVGYWDLGANRRRIEALRESLRAAGVAE